MKKLRKHREMPGACVYSHHVWYVAAWKYAQSRGLGARCSPPFCSESTRRLNQLEPTDRLCGAEVNSLFSLLGQRLTTGEVSTPLHVHLLVSETPDGKWVGDVLCTYLRKLPQIAEVEVTTVEGLRDDDPKRFGSQGLRMLVKDAARILKQAAQDHPDCQRIINATGGYKAEISFAGLIGQALKIPVVYLFENFSECIELPPMPVHFDQSLWEKHYRLFQTLSEREAVPVEELALDRVDHSIQALLERVEIDGQEYVTLTPVLELMHQSFMMQRPQLSVKPPSNTLTPQQRKQSLTTVGHHKVTGEDAFISKLADLPWIERIESIQMGSHGQSKVARGKSEANSEIWVWYAKGDFSKLFRLVTTGEDTGHWLYCVQTIEGLIT